ncbi:hypothetical protein RR48_10903 [Papilio machaon]|uniref:Uncharacterized protein n=1 Tax=Papilio machaon TaxID=76193 RepID=A0A194R889_PAPMA|nr:hypothetical protein RR48_10903 [Papilio machaon]
MHLLRVAPAPNAPTFGENQNIGRVSVRLTRKARGLDVASPTRCRYCIVGLVGAKVRYDRLVKVSSLGSKCS